MSEGTETPPAAAEEAQDQEQLFPGGPTVASLQDSDVLASLSAYARAFGIDRETLRRCLLEHEVQPAAERGGHKLYALRHVYQAWTAVAGETDPDTLSSFKRLAWLRGDREKIRLQVERGELVPALDMERVVGQLNQLFVRGLETVEDVIERDCGLTPQQATKLQAHLDGLREELYEQLAGDADEDVDVGAEVQPPAEPAPAKAVATPASTVSRETAGSAVDDAAAFLRRELAGGARPTAELIENGKQAGLSEATLRRAKAQMGSELVARRQGRGWVWQLAQDAQQA